MGQVLRITRWEWFKLRRRWMPWILLAPLVIIPQIWLWAEFVAHGNINRYERPSLSFRIGPLDNDYVRFSCPELDDGTVASSIATWQETYRQEALDAIAQIREFEVCEKRLEDQIRAREWHSQIFVAPVSLANGLVATHFIAMLMIAFLAASVMGSEYGQGTLRSVLAGGVGRWQVLASKALLLTLVSGAMFIIVSAPVLVSSLIATSLAPAGFELADPGGWSTVMVMFGKVMYGLVPYIALTLFLTVWSKSTSLGVSIAIGYILVEGIVISFLGYRFENERWFQNFLDFMLGPAVSGWFVTGDIRATGTDAALFPLDKAQNNLLAFFVILAYTATLSGATLRLFQRSDITSARSS